MPSAPVTWRSRSKTERSASPNGPGAVSITGASSAFTHPPTGS